MPVPLLLSRAYSVGSQMGADGEHALRRGALGQHPRVTARAELLQIPLVLAPPERIVLSRSILNKREIRRAKRRMIVPSRRRESLEHGVDTAE